MPLLANWTVDSTVARSKLSNRDEKGTEASSGRGGRLAGGGGRPWADILNHTLNRCRSGRSNSTGHHDDVLSRRSQMASGQSLEAHVRYTMCPMCPMCPEKKVVRPG